MRCTLRARNVGPPGMQPVTQVKGREGGAHQFGHRASTRSGGWPAGSASVPHIGRKGIESRFQRPAQAGVNVSGSAARSR